MSRAVRLGFLIVAVSALMVGLAACTRLASDEAAGAPLVPEFGLVSPEQAAALINEGRQDPDFVLLDIRTTAEVEAGHISGAVMLDYYSESFRDDLALLDRDKTYLIYCRTGNRTGKTFTIMEELGFGKVSDLDGGITDWMAAGYAICLGALDAHHLCISGDMVPSTSP